MDPVQRNPCQIVVSVPDQELRLFEEGRLLRSYDVSTAERGTGSEEGSYRTPLGRFTIREMIGGDTERGTVFKSRLPVGIWSSDEKVEDDLVVSRILWLDGIDDDNRNTYDRYIYIHGTNHERRIGEALSHGCVRMMNADVIDLFDRVEVGTPVEIVGERPV